MRAAEISRPLPIKKSRKTKIRQADIERVLRAVAKTGVSVSTYLMPDGSIKLEHVNDDDTPKNELKSDIIL
jgi:hypothetical protein